MPMIMGLGISSIDKPSAYLLKLSKENQCFIENKMMIDILYNVVYWPVSWHVYLAYAYWRLVYVAYPVV